MKRIGQVFKESDSDSSAMIVLEGEQPLGDDAHRYYDRLIRQLQDDPKHVQHVQDFWGDPLTAAGAQSADGKAAYVQLNLAGNQGQTLANESVEAVRHIVDRTPPPPGVKVYVTGPAAMAADMTPEWRQTVITDHGGNPRGDLHDVASRLPLGHHGNSFAADGRHRIDGGPGNRRVPRPASSLSGLPPSPLICWYRSGSRRERTTASSSSAGIKRPVRPARIGKRPSTPRTAGSPMLSWPPV